MTTPLTQRVPAVDQENEPPAPGIAATPLTTLPSAVKRAGLEVCPAHAHAPAPLSLLQLPLLPACLPLDTPPPRRGLCLVRHTTGRSFFSTDSLLPCERNVCCAFAASSPQEAQTPASQSRGTGSRRGSSWEGALEAYVAEAASFLGGAGASDAAGPAAVLTAQHAQRLRLVSAVRADPESPAAWLAVLSAEEACVGAPVSAKTAAAMAAHLARLYDHATRLLPRAGRSRDEPFLRVWLGHVRVQAASRPDDARDTFKFLRSQRLGDGLALMWLAWASFEAALGRKDKAAAVLAKGIEHGAQPVQALTQAQADLAAGRPLQPQPPPVAPVAQTVPVAAATMTGGSATPWMVRAGAAGGVHTASLTHTGGAVAAVTVGATAFSGSTGSLTTSTSSSAAAGGGGSTTTTSSASGGTGEVPSTATLAGLVASAGTAQPSAGGPLATPVSAVTLASVSHVSSQRGSAVRGAGWGSAAGASHLPPAPEDRAALYDTDGHLVCVDPPSSGSGSDDSGSSSGRASSSADAAAPAPRRALGMPRAAAPPVVDPDATVPVPRKHAVVAAAAPPPVTAAPSAVVDEDATVPVTRPRVQPTAVPAVPQVARPPAPSMMPPPAPSAEEMAARQRARAAAAAAATGAVQSSDSVQQAPMPPPPQPSAQVSVSAGMPPRSSAAAPSAATVPAPGGSIPVPGGRPREDDTFVHVRGVRYTKLECVGQGGTCKVFKVITQQRKVLAVKRIRLTGGHAKEEAIANFLSEIALLERLRGRANIIQLIDSEVIRQEGLIYLVLEFGETDLAQLLARRAASRAALATSATPADDVVARVADNQNFLRLYFQQMCEAVATIHNERIIHSDLKPANFLIVEGSLKLIDFGIAKAVAPSSSGAAHDTTHIVREHQVGTINYMSPEAVLNGQCNAHGAVLKIGRASDVWSLGCILYQMVYGHTPFSHITNMVHKLAAITNPGAASCLAFPPTGNPALEDLMRSALAHDPANRIALPAILSHPFIRPQQQQAPSPPPVSLQPQPLAAALLGAARAGGELTAEDASSLARDIVHALESGRAPPDVQQWLATRAALVKEQQQRAELQMVAPPVPPPPPPPVMPAASAPMAPPPPVSLEDLMRQRKALKQVPNVERAEPVVPAGAGGLHASADELARQKQLLRPAPAAAPSGGASSASLFDAAANPAMAALRAAVQQRHVPEEAGTQTLAWGAPQP